MALHLIFYQKKNPQKYFQNFKSHGKNLEK